MKNSLFHTLLCLILLPLLLPGRSSAVPASRSSESTDSTATARVVQAVRAIGLIRIDGVLNEQEWSRPGVTSFTERDPVEGIAPSEHTEVWVAYDDGSLYIAARMYDHSPDSIVARLGRRDAELNSDWFYVGIDSYHDKRTGFFFGVYASGSVVDGTLFNDSWDDDTWDGVWETATAIDSLGWTAELRIPFSQLRFTAQPEYVWGINFARQIERRRERSDYVLVPKKESGWVSRFADLVGIRDIDPPRRLEILPYAVGKTVTTNRIDNGDPFRSPTMFSSNFGADAKMGLGSNLTLNLTLNPDFGQVEVDPAIVNLTQFETFYSEKRPFFIEGTSFFDFGYGGVNSNYGFNWGAPEFFYSRRIGRAPRGSVQHDGYVDYPEATTILGAAKVTGKITEGLSIGSVNAITERERARVQTADGQRYSDVVEPLASHNVLRTLQEFNQGRQGLGLMGTAVLRDLNQPYLEPEYSRHAYSLGVDGWTNLDVDQMFVMNGWLATTRIEGSTDYITDLQQSPLHYYQRPDISHVSVDPFRTSLSGYAGRIAVNKQKGNLKFNSAVGVISPGFDTNDMGFLFRTDIINAHVVLGYQWYEPSGMFLQRGFQLATFRNFDFSGNRTGDGYFLFYNAEFANYWGVNGSFMHMVAWLDNRITRGGPMMRTTNGYNADIEIMSDSRQLFQYGVDVNLGRTESGGHIVTVEPSFVWNPSAGVKLSFSPSFMRDITIAYWVMHQPDPLATATYGTRYVFGRLDQRELAGEFRLNWTFTPSLSLQLYVQPLISVGRYTSFKELKQPGTYTFNEFGRDNGSTITEVEGGYQVDPDGTGRSIFLIENPDFNSKSLRGNAILRWEYMPGSTLYLVWTRSSEGGAHPGEFDFMRDARGLFGLPQHEDALVLKIAYWWNP